MSDPSKRRYSSAWAASNKDARASGSSHESQRQHGSDFSRATYPGFDQRWPVEMDSPFWSGRTPDLQSHYTGDHSWATAAPSGHYNLDSGSVSGRHYSGGYYHGRGPQYDLGPYPDQGPYQEHGRYRDRGPKDDPRSQGPFDSYHDRHPSSTHDYSSTASDDMNYLGRSSEIMQDTMLPFTESGKHMRSLDKSVARQDATLPEHALNSEFRPALDSLKGQESRGEDSGLKRRLSEKPHYSQRRANRDEFDGPVQFLDMPSDAKVVAQDQELPQVPVSLDVREQDEVLRQVNAQLSRCAFDFVAKYQFPIPLEPGKRPVQEAGDREWTEWAFLIKRLATKRRIPTRVLYHGQIKQLVTVLENSLEMRHASAHQSRPPKDDRNVLQLISAGIQVAKMLKDAVTMEYLDSLYQKTECLIQERRHPKAPIAN